MRRSRHACLGIAVLLSATFPLSAQNTPPADIKTLDQQHPGLLISQQEYAESREKLRKTSIALHYNALFGAGTDSTGTVPTDEEPKPITKALDEALSKMVSAHRQYLSILGRWTREKLTEEFPASIRVTKNTDASAYADKGQISLSVGFLRTQVKAAVAPRVKDIYNEFTDSMIVMFRNERFTDYHVLHDLRSGSAGSLLHCCRPPTLDREEHGNR